MCPSWPDSLTKAAVESSSSKQECDGCIKMGSAKKVDRLSASEQYPYRDYRDYYNYRDAYGYNEADALSRRSGYGHSDYHHDYDKHGSLDHYGHKKECCPLVVKPLVVLALLGSIAAATAFFNTLITMNIGRKRRRRRRRATLGEDASVALVGEDDDKGLHRGASSTSAFLDRLLDLVQKGRGQKKS